ncbi:MAG: PEGA domain-containing protein [Polyangiales bacterium]
MMAPCALWRSVTCALALLVCVLFAAAAHAQKRDDATDRARVHFRNGIDFYHEENFRAALIEFKRAYKAAPHYKLLYNLGQVSLELQEDGPAIDYFTHYLREGADELTSDRKLEVQTLLVRLQARLAHAVITADQSGAEIYVDDTLVGTTPLSGPVRLSVGRRRISAHKPGFVTAERTLEVASGDHPVIALALKASTSALGPLSVTPQAPEDNTWSAAAWVGIATGVVGAGALTLTVLTGVAQASFDAERRQQTSDDTLQDLRQDAKRKALAADLAWGVTVVGAAVTTVLLLTSPGSERSGTSEPTPTGVKVELGAGSFQLRGRF